MAEKNDLGWLKKPEHIKNDRPKSTRRRSTSKSRAKRMTSQPAWFRFLKHVLIITAVGLFLAVGTHFALRLGTRHGVERIVPDFVAMSLNEAKQIAAEKDLQIIINDSVYAPAYQGGAVLEQLPKAGTIVKPGRSVYVMVNRTQKMTVEIPYVAGRSLRQAISMLRSASLEVEKMVYVPDLAGDYVLAQMYNGETLSEEQKLRVPIGSGISLHVGLSEEQDVTTAPQVLNRSLSEAKRMIWEAGLNVGAVRYDDKIDVANMKNARVFMQSIPALEQVLYGETIALSLTLDEEKGASQLALFRKKRGRQERIDRLIDSARNVALDQNIALEDLLEQLSFEEDELKF